MPHQCQLEITEALQITRHNKGLKFNIALNYGSAPRFIAAVKKLATGLLAGEICLEEISEESFAACLTTPDARSGLINKDSGRNASKQFSLWQIAYTGALGY